MYALTDRIVAVSPGEQADGLTVVILPHYHPGEYPWWSEGTRDVLRAMEAINFEGMTVLDFGTGASAILAVAAARLGAARVVALEIHPEIADLARQHVTANALGAVIEINPDDVPWGFDVVLANLGFTEREEADRMASRGARYIVTLTDGTVLCG